LIIYGAGFAEGMPGEGSEVVTLKGFMGPYKCIFKVEKVTPNSLVVFAYIIGIEGKV